MTGERLYEHLPVVAQNVACSFAGWRRARDRFTPYFHHILTEWEASAQWPLSMLHEVQWRRLRRLLTRARRFVPYYRRLDVPAPTECTDPLESILRTLECLPVLDKQIYREQPEGFLAEDIPPRRIRRGKTSGTTGSALPLYYTPEALAEEYATVWRLRRAHGCNLYDPHFTFGGQLIVPLSQQGPPFWRRNAWSDQILFSLYHMSRENLPHYIDALHELPARYIQGYPSSLHLLGREMLEAGRPLPEGRLRAVFPSSESLLAFQREVIEQAFGAPIFDRYGTSEFVVSMTGCSEGNLHVDMEFGIVEVEVEERGDGWEQGPLLVTGLGNEATPFLRYRIGDVGTRLLMPCPCGRPGEVFADVDGRVEDYVVTPDGRWIGRLDHIFKEQLDVAEAQILQDDRDSIRILVVPRASFDEDSRRSLAKEVRSRLGHEIGLDIALVDEIPREANGKFRAVKSRVGRSTS